MSKRSIHQHIVYVTDEECVGIVEKLGAFSSLVKYNKNGFEYTINLLNEDLIFLEDIRIDIEEEEI
jgi:hypothetical protein